MRDGKRRQKKTMHPERRDGECHININYSVCMCVFVCVVRVFVPGGWCAAGVEWGCRFIIRRYVQRQREGETVPRPWSRLFACVLCYHILDIIITYTHTHKSIYTNRNIQVVYKI